MKKLVLIFVAGVCFGQQLSKVLTVEVNGAVYGSYIDWSKAFGGPGGIGTIEINQLKTWRAFRGGLPISEAEFYRVAGYDSLSLRAATYRSQSKAMLLGGCLLGLVGVGALVVGGFKEPPDVPLVVLGGTGWFVGLMLEYGGVMRLKTHLTPASFALRVAEEYNRSLR